MKLNVQRVGVAFACLIFCVLIPALPQVVRSDGQGAKVALPTTRATAANLELVVTQVTATAVAGDRIMLRAVLTNGTAEPIRFATPPDGRRGFSFAVKDRSDRAVSTTSWGTSYLGEARDGSFVTRTVKPGESLSTELNLSRCFDLTRGGVYFVEVGFPFGPAPISTKLQITVERPD